MIDFFYYTHYVKHSSTHLMVSWSHPAVFVVIANCVQLVFGFKEILSRIVMILRRRKQRLTFCKCQKHLPNVPLFFIFYFVTNIKRLKWKIFLSNCFSSYFLSYFSFSERLLCTILVICTQREKSEPGLTFKISIAKWTLVYPFRLIFPV